MKEANFDERGFQQGESAQKRLELVAKAVVSGYNTTINNTSFGIKKKEFIKGDGKPHEYMSYVGAGIACGVFKKHSFEKFLDKASPTSGLLLLNGLGFYYAYFKPEQTIKRRFFVPKNVKKDPFFLECYDNGIGRALWFYHGANPESIAQMIAAFPEERRAGVWAGVGLAATYAGGVAPNKILLLKQLSGKYYDSLAEGCVLASHTRDVAGNPHEDDSTELILTKKNAAVVQAFARKTDVALKKRRYIDGKHSLQVFLEKIRAWIRKNHEEEVQYISLSEN